jgi:hypothetical protein
MPKYTTDPAVSGVFIPELGSFNADETGAFDLPDDPRVPATMAELGVRLLPLLEHAPPPPAPATGDTPEPPADPAPATPEPPADPAPARTTRRTKPVEVTG